MKRDGRYDYCCAFENETIEQHAIIFLTRRARHRFSVFATFVLTMSGREKKIDPKRETIVLQKITLEKTQHGFDFVKRFVKPFTIR